MNNSTDTNCILFLDNDPVLAARVLFDDDLKRLILYLAVVASKAVKEMAEGVDFKKEGYTIYNTDIEPPFDCDVRWIESTPSVWRWSADYFRAMLEEYEVRFETKHPSHDLARLFDSDGELEKGQVDEFVPPSISAIDSKYHVDANFRTLQMYDEKNKGKNKFKVSVLNTCRNLYKQHYNDENSGCDYTNRAVPAFIRPPRPDEGQIRAARTVPAWIPPRRT